LGFFCRWGSQNYLFRWSFQVARIIGMSHQHQAYNALYINFKRSPFDTGSALYVVS
jgi:hypothetical protein